MDETAFLELQAGARMLQAEVEHVLQQRSARDAARERGDADAYHVAEEKLRQAASSLGFRSTQRFLAALDDALKPKIRLAYLSGDGSFRTWA